MKKISLFLVLTIILNIFCFTNLNVVATEVNDDAIVLEANSSIAGYNNLSAQKWGSFTDNTFFAMTRGDTTGNTYLIIKTPDGSDVKNFSVVTYKHQDVSGSFAFAGSSELNGEYHIVDVEESAATATAQGGFGQRIYSYNDGLDDIKYVKIIFPADSENWRLMIASFTLNEGFGDSDDNESVLVGGYKDDALTFADNSNVISYSNLSAQTWGDFTDNTFFGMNSGDTTGNTYLSIRVPTNTVKVIVNAYMHQDVSVSYSFETIPGGKELIPAVNETASGHAGFTKGTYTFENIAADTTGIKIIFPADSQNWRLMISSFEVVTEEIDDSGVIKYTTTADIRVGNIKVNDDFKDLTGELKANLTVKSTNPDTIKAIAVLALYDNNTLIGIDVEELDVFRGTNPCTLDGITKEKGVGDKINVLLWTDMNHLAKPICKIHADKPDIQGESLKVLAIGNSFSVDGMEYLYQLAQDAGIENIVLGNLYIGGCSLEQHWSKAKNNTAAYEYYKNTNGTWNTLPAQTMEYGIQDEAWDVITLQQASPTSGVASSFDPYLENLIDYVNSNKRNEDAKLAWHMTWAYQQDSDHSGFVNYNNSQETMYNAIVSAVQNEVLPTNAFDFVIPSGTAVQNVRTSYIGDTLTRDGYHLSYKMGRYIAGLTWLKAITGKSIDDIGFLPPASNMDDEAVDVAKEAVNAACVAPYEVTESTHKTKSEINYDNYTLLEWTPSVGYFWNSTEASTMKEGMQQYIATPQFAKADLPVGTILVIDEGYQYRPEGWISMDVLNSPSSRPGNVTENVIEVGNVWWGNYNYRAFNISKIGSSDSITKEEASHFKIYIPKID